MVQVKSLDEIGIYTYCYLFVDSFNNRKRELLTTKLLLFNDWLLELFLVPEVSEYSLTSQHLSSQWIENFLKIFRFPHWSNQYKISRLEYVVAQFKHDLL